MNIRTDLAIEAKEMYSIKNVESGDPDGVISNTESKNNSVITTVEIINKNGSEKLKKPIGKYVTIESKVLKNLDPKESKTMSYLIKEELEKIINIDKNSTVLVVGLGNWNITPDALGPKVVSNIMVTKHLKKYIPEYIDEDLCAVCAISPGVMGITGVETSDLVSGIVKKINPSLVIAIDALASKSPGRISTTVQITDTGITPGSGVGNKREGLNKDSLGVPVIAIGVPTVVDAVSIASEMIDKIYSSIKLTSEKESAAIKAIEKLKSSSAGFLSDESENLMVTPKEVDNLISHISTVISNGINLALHPDIDLEYIESFTF